MRILNAQKFTSTNQNSTWPLDFSCWRPSSWFPSRKSVSTFPRPAKGTDLRPSSPQFQLPTPLPTFTYTTRELYTHIRSNWNVQKRFLCLLACRLPFLRRRNLVAVPVDILKSVRFRILDSASEKKPSPSSFVYWRFSFLFASVIVVLCGWILLRYGYIWHMDKLALSIDVFEWFYSEGFRLLEVREQDDGSRLSGWWKVSWNVQFKVRSSCDPDGMFKMFKRLVRRQHFFWMLPYLETSFKYP